jgi:uncharacterized protein involved in exopolysaccharide biosynthesis
MSGNRQLNFNDYATALRRRTRFILVLALVMSLSAYGVSFLVPPRYTSRSLLQVAAQVLPAGYVKPIVTEKLPERVAALEQRVLTRAHLLPVIETLGLASKGQSADSLVDRIRSNVGIIPAEPGTNPAASGPVKKKLLDRDDVPGFYVSFTWDSSRQAQQVCSEITSMLLDENQKAREQIGQSTTDFLTRQLEQAKDNLDTLDSQLAAFKQRHLGRLPGDVENNLKILSGLDSQLDANTELLSRAQQEKSFAESLLTQEVAAWKASQESPNLPSLREQLIALQNQLVILQSRYTEQHPDVVKVKNDIDEIKRKLNEVKQESDQSQPEVAKGKLEPADILRLRERVHQQDGLIDRATIEQTRLKEQIAAYQGRLALSPEVEEQYKKLTRDNETAHTIYDGLLANKNSAEMQTEMEREQQGEQIKMLEPASLPAAPSFPVRWMFAVGGLTAGLTLAVSVIIGLELADRSIRDESDVSDLLNLPTLAFVPWTVTPLESPDQRDRWRNWLRTAPAK